MPPTPCRALRGEEGIADALELFPELERRWQRSGRLLSGGEQQMLVLAQALVSRPSFLLVDELSLGLAPVVVKRLLPDIESVAASGVGVLLIEQFAHLALSLAEPPTCSKEAASATRARPRSSRAVPTSSTPPTCPATRSSPAGTTRLGAAVRAAVTESRASMRIVDVPDPGEPSDGEVVIRPEAVGLCGSDFHYFLGHIGSVDDTQLYPRVLGHEAAGIVEAVGPGCPPHLRAGERVAMWPLVACGRCYPCRIGRENACANISLIGVHRDGALQDRLRIPASQVFPVGDRDPALAALIEPVSIAVRAVVRGRVAEGEKVVVFGAGPIGQAIAVAAIDRGASVLVVDRVRSRLERGKAIGADVLSRRGG